MISRSVFIPHSLLILIHLHLSFPLTLTYFLPRHTYTHAQLYIPMLNSTYRCSTLYTHAQLYIPMPNSIYPCSTLYTHAQLFLTFNLFDELFLNSARTPFGARRDITIGQRDMCCSSEFICSDSRGGTSMRETIADDSPP